MSAGRAAALAESLAAGREEVRLYKQLARLREDAPIREKLGDLEWKGAHPRLKELCGALGETSLPSRIQRWLEA